MNNTYFPSLPKVPTQLQAVEVSISADYFDDILAFLLTKKISFRMTYKSTIVPAKPLEPDLTKEMHESSNGVCQNITITRDKSCQSIRTSRLCATHQIQ
jgi:hypothetical protein